MTEVDMTPEQKIALGHARYLTEYGVPVFVAPPAITNGEWDADGGTGHTGYYLPGDWQHTVADSGVLDEWQSGWAVCAVTGHGVDVVDVDPRNGGDTSFAAMRDDGLVPRSYGQQQTPSGGTHELIASLGVGKRLNFRPGVDVLAGDSDGGGRGFVFLAPAERASKTDGEVRAYSWATPPDLTMLEMVGPDDTGVPLAQVLHQTREGTLDRAEIDVSSPPADDQVAKAIAVLAKAERLMLATTEGTRNNTLIRLLPKLYQFVLGGCLDEAAVDERMHRAAAHIGIGDEYAATSASAWEYAHRDGAERPAVETAADVFGSVAIADVSGKFQPLDLAQLLDPDRPPREYVVDPMIAAGSSVALVAPAGHRKSLVLLALALAVARGDEAFAGMTIPRARRVLYLDMENTEDDLRERLLSFGVSLHDQLANFLLVSLPSMEPLDTAKGGADFTEAVDAFGLEAGDVVVLDSYQRITQAGENDSDTTRGYYRHTGVRLKARGLTVIRTDNTGKDVSRGARGSSGKRDDVDVEYLMESKGSYVDIMTGKARQRGVSNLTLRISDEDSKTTFHSDHKLQPESRAEECARILDEIVLPVEAGERAALSALREKGHEIPRNAVREAVRLRKNRAADARRAFAAEGD